MKKENIVNKKLIIGLLILLTALLLLISPAAATPQIPAAFFTADNDVSDSVGAIGPASPANPQACPAGCGLPNSIESADGFPFCVYYDSADTTLAQAQDVRDYTDDYWDVYLNDYGWAMPTEFTNGKFKVCLIDNGSSCNGSVSIGTDSMNVWEGCDSSTEMMMAVVGHELSHAGPQLGPNNLTSANFDALWAHEGMARSGEDKVFNSVDNDAGAMARPFSYNKEVDEFFVNPNHDLTSDSWRYESAIWWTYYAEQCGSDPATEPGLGVADSFGEFWDRAHSSDNIAALNLALNHLGCPQFNIMVPKFVLANYTKDLTGLPDSSYYYIDETNAGNPDTYGPLSPHNGGTINNSSTTATWNNRSIARYGADYFVAAPDPVDCPVITAKFHADSGSPFYHIVTSDSGAFKTHVQGSGTDWVRSFLNDGVTTVAAIAGSLGSSSQVDVELSCPDPVIEIQQPNQLAPEYVGGHADGDKFLVQVLVTSSTGGPVVDGLTAFDFAVQVGAHNATIVGGGQVEHQYFLQVVAPDPGSNGPYDLHVDLQESGTSTVIASDSETEAIVYDATNEDNIYVVDKSGSMGWYDPTPWEALVDAFKLAVDTTNSSEGIAVVPFESNVNPAPFAMQFATLPVRNNAKTYIDGITPSGGTSIGDGMAGGVAQRTGSPTGNSRCRYVLLSDGEENSPLYWADVKASVQATGCPVMAIAFGPGANETLMQQIASDTGGAYYYNDVYIGTSLSAVDFTAADMVLDLGSTYQFAQVRGERERLLTEKGQADYRQTYTHTVPIDASVLSADFVLNWFSQYYADMRLQLVQPDGTIISESTDDYDFEDFDTGHVGWRIDNPQEGDWELQVELGKAEVRPVSYQVMVTGKTKITAQLLLPAIQRQFRTGDLIPIHALVTSGQGPLPGLTLMAAVTAPDGTTQMVPMMHTGGGMYLGHYTLGNQANDDSPPPEDGYDDPKPNDEGSYQVKLLVNGQGGLQRETQGAFSILEADDENNNGIPDSWEEQYGDPGDDPDGDQLLTGDEYYAGTDPLNSDTDGGGENDYSEVEIHYLDPLDPSDDQIEAPEFFQANPYLDGDVVLSYDFKDEYIKMSLYRASSPWDLIVPELPDTGVYTDTSAVIGNAYDYRLVAIDGDNHWSRVLESEQVTAAEDPIPPEGQVIINGGAPSTTSRNVTLTFGPLQDDLGYEAFADIVQMKISNDPSLTGASWQPFAQDVPWVLAPNFGELAKVYVLFKDSSSNDSVGPAIGMIFYDVTGLFLPLVAMP